MKSFPLRNPGRIRLSYQIELRYHKIDIERSKDKLSFIEHISAWSTQNKWHLVQVDLWTIRILFLLDIMGFSISVVTSDTTSTAPSILQWNVIFGGDQIDAAVQHTWENISSDTTWGKWLPTVVSCIFVVPG